MLAAPLLEFVVVNLPIMVVELRNAFSFGFILARILIAARTVITTVAIFAFRRVRVNAFDLKLVGMLDIATRCFER